jgi:hypothetical protein
VIGREMLKVERAAVPDVAATVFIRAKVET